MNFSRRSFLSLAASGVALPTLTGTVRAQAYPTRPVRIVVGFAAGGSNDIIARLLGHWLSERLGQAFVVENKPGAGGNIAINTVLQAPPDGYTLLSLTLPNVVTAPLPPNIDIAQELEPIAGIYQAHLVMLVHPEIPAKSVPEFIAHAKANPGKLTMASVGNGSPPHLTGELFKIMAGVDLIHVPYRGGGAALTDLLSGQVKVLFSNLPTEQYVKTGQLRALAVTTTTRSSTFPELPTVGEFIPGFESSVSFGICAPKKTPREIIEKLNAEIKVFLSDAQIQARLVELGGKQLVLSSSGFAEFITKDVAKWDKVVRAANIKPD